MRYLVDTSALVRILRRQVDPLWYDLVDRGLISVCMPVLLETLCIADAKGYVELELDVHNACLAVAVPDGAWELAAVIHRELASHSAHQGLSVTDLLVAATAIRLKLEVLHEDADFETVARFVPELRQRRISTAPEL
ncbi:PIN domain-containing protein [Dactylosporangium sp. NPDC005555]|uniref:PIN domain-containing protein n=1 Tax=Dactylosporangium sp. NPDC005555 TaxID=3154889 RepID=UPI0033A15580